jgi:hypothetical protein
MLPSNLIVELTAQELADVVQAASELTARSVHIPNYSRYDMTRSQAQTDLVGLKGEYAVAKLFGLGLDACGIRLKGIAMDGGCDIVLPNGMTVQVKTVEVYKDADRPYWFLLETANPAEFTADIGILAYVLRFDPGKVKIPGYVTRQRFLAEHVLALPRCPVGPRVASKTKTKHAAMATCRFDPIEQLLVHANTATPGAVSSVVAPSTPTARTLTAAILNAGKTP